MILKDHEEERKMSAKQVPMQPLNPSRTREMGDYRRILRIKKLSELLGIGISSIYAKLDPKSPSHDKTFPAPVRLGAKAVGWRYSEVMAWIDSLPYSRADLADEHRGAA